MRIDFLFGPAIAPPPNDAEHDLNRRAQCSDAENRQQTDDTPPHDITFQLKFAGSRRQHKERDHNHRECPKEEIERIPRQLDKEGLARRDQAVPLDRQGVLQCGADFRLPHHHFSAMSE